MYRAKIRYQDGDKTKECAYDDYWKIEKEPAEKQNNGNGKKTIVLADDDKGIRENLAEKLERSGYKVFTAENGKKAFDLVEKENPYALITDNQMPVMTGLELVKELRKKNINIPAILNTGLIDERLEDEVSKINDFYVVSKIYPKNALEKLESL